mmetsp:Transcript_28579/g.73318  ORF Transcript_28579/g.73318 Transcript_28579/m.73318 type:complete len:202 (+) Transcript_28579:146-751(+)
MIHWSNARMPARRMPAADFSSTEFHGRQAAATTSTPRVQPAQKALSATSTTFTSSPTRRASISRVLRRRLRRHCHQDLHLHRRCRHRRLLIRRRLSLCWFDRGSSASPQMPTWETRPPLPSVPTVARPRWDAPFSSMAMAIRRGDATRSLRIRPRAPKGGRSTNMTSINSIRPSLCEAVPTHVTRPTTMRPPTWMMARAWA